MSALPTGYSFHILHEINSTNIYAMKLLHEGLAGDGDVFFANLQLDGKGQRGKNWHAQAGESILMSLVLNTSNLAPSQSFRLSAVVALAACNFLRELIGKEITIKWPNDLYLNDRKAGGILIENLINGGVWKWSVVGIGININQLSFPPHLPQAISVQMATGKLHDTVDLAKKLCANINHVWQELQLGKWPEILAQYNANLYGKNSLIKLKRGNVVFPCLIKEVNSQGVLIAGENSELHFEHGEVEWLREAVDS